MDLSPEAVSVLEAAVEHFLRDYNAQQLMKEVLSLLPRSQELSARDIALGRSMLSGEMPEPNAYRVRLALPPPRSRSSCHSCVPPCVWRSGGSRRAALIFAGTVKHTRVDSDCNYRHH